MSVSLHCSHKSEDTAYLIFVVNRIAEATDFKVCFFRSFMGVGGIPNRDRVAFVMSILSRTRTYISCFAFTSM